MSSKISFGQLISRRAHSHIEPPSMMLPIEEMTLMQMFEQFEEYPEEDYTLYLGNMNASQRSTRSVKMISSQLADKGRGFDDFIHGEIGKNMGPSTLRTGSVFNKQNVMDQPKRSPLANKPSQKNNFIQSQKTNKRIVINKGNSVSRNPNQPQQNTKKIFFKRNQQQQYEDQSMSQEQSYQMQESERRNIKINVNYAKNNYGNRNNSKQQFCEESSIEEEYPSIPNVQKIISPRQMQKEVIHHQQIDYEEEEEEEYEPPKNQRIEGLKNQFAKIQEEKVQEVENIINFPLQESKESQKSKQNNELQRYIQHQTENVQKDIEDLARDYITQSQKLKEEDELLLDQSDEKKTNLRIAQAKNKIGQAIRNYNHNCKNEKQVTEVEFNLPLVVPQKNYNEEPSNSELQVGYSFSDNIQQNNINSDHHVNKTEVEISLGNIHHVESENPSISNAPKVEESQQLEFKKRDTELNIPVEHVPNIQSVVFEEQRKREIQPAKEIRGWGKMISSESCEKRQQQKACELKESMKQQDEIKVKESIPEHDQSKPIEEESKKAHEQLVPLKLMRAESSKCQIQDEILKKTPQIHQKQKRQDEQYYKQIGKPLITVKELKESLIHPSKLTQYKAPVSYPTTTTVTRVTYDHNFTEKQQNLYAKPISFEPTYSSPLITENMERKPSEQPRNFEIMDSINENAKKYAKPLENRQQSSTKRNFLESLDIKQSIHIDELKKKECKEKPVNDYGIKMTVHQSKDKKKTPSPKSPANQPSKKGITVHSSKQSIEKTKEFKIESAVEKKETKVQEEGDAFEFDF